MTAARLSHSASALAGEQSASPAVALGRGWPSRLAAGLVAAIAALALVGWAIGSERLKSVVPGFATMKPNTALCLALLAGALWRLATAQRRDLIAARCAAAAVFLLAGATLAEHLTGRDFGIDQSVMADASAARGRMAAATAVNFLLLAFGVALRTCGEARFRRAAEWPVLAAAFVTTIAFTTHLFGASAAFAFDSIFSIALHTAFAFACLSAGMLMLRRDEGLVGVMVQPLAGGFMARRIFPLAFLLPVLAGSLSLEGERRGWYSHGVGLALFATVCAWTLSRLVRFTGQKMNGSDAEQRRALVALRDSEESARRVLDTAYDAFVEIDADGRITQWNPRAAELFGWSKTEAAGRKLSETIVPPDLRVRHDEGLRRYLATGEGPVLRRTIELAAIRRDGRQIPVELTVWPVNERSGQRFSAFIHDISDRKAAEAAMARARDAALESARIKSEFLANMSHEIRTPMNGVLGMLQLLDDAQLSPEQRDFADTARTSAESLLALLDDILDLSKIEAGKLAIEAADFNVREVVESTLELLAGRAQAKGLELIGAFDATVPAAVCGDSTRLRQVLLNLAGNAVKFTERGEIVIRVRATPDGAATRLAFEVRDTGIGIPAEVQQRLFQPFTQADGSTTRKFGGTGLGLAISRRLVELMGGAIGVTSEPGCGAAFAFDVRVQSAGAPPPLVRRASLAGRRVLVVDDNATNRSVLHHQLTSWGMRHAEAPDAATALEVLRASAASDPIPVALLDLQMPVMDGLALARAIKADPAIAATRLVMLTSLGTRLDADTRRAMGIDECLLKPVRLARLHDAIARCLGDASPEVPRAADRVTAPRRPLRILLAEDNAVNRKVALGQLRKLGYAADIAVNGREAVAAHARTTYDVVLMDCEMPEVEGYEATRQIRAAERAADGARERPVHIIALTAHALEGTREKCLAAGMDDYLSKPMNPAALAAALERVPADQPCGVLVPSVP